MTDPSKPKTLRKRPGARQSVNVADRLEMLISGKLTIEELDDDEIRRMQLRDKNGDFKGRPPKWIPREFALALRSEHARRFSREMSEMVPDALNAIRELVNSKHLAPGDATRLKAAEAILERNFGKIIAQQEINLTVEKGKSFDEFADEVLVIEEIKEHQPRRPKPKEITQ